jgi:hypothetical protein
MSSSKTSLLDWPGRNKIDPHAEFLIEASLDDLDLHFLVSQSTFCRDVKLEYNRLNEDGSKTTMPLHSTFERHTWTVGVAVNQWHYVGQFSQKRQRFAHWGLYIYRWYNPNKEEVFLCLCSRSEAPVDVNRRSHTE